MKCAIVDFVRLCPGKYRLRMDDDLVKCPSWDYGSRVDLPYLQHGDQLEKIAEIFLFFPHATKIWENL